jgi:hypothetical protein
LKKIVVDEGLDIDMLKEVSRGSFQARPNAGHQLFLVIDKSLPSQTMSRLLISSSTKEHTPAS